MRAREREEKQIEAKQKICHFTDEFFDRPQIVRSVGRMVCCVSLYLPNLIRIISFHENVTKKPKKMKLKPFLKCIKHEFFRLPAAKGLIGYGEKNTKHFCVDRSFERTVGNGGD